MLAIRVVSSHLLLNIPVIFVLKHNAIPSFVTTASVKLFHRFTTLAGKKMFLLCSITRFFPFKGVTSRRQVEVPGSSQFKVVFNSPYTIKTFQDLKRLNHVYYVSPFL